MLPPGFCSRSRRPQPTQQDSLTASILFLQSGKQCLQASVVSQAARWTSGRQSSGRAWPPQPCLAHQRRRSPSTAAQHLSFPRDFNQDYSVVWEEATQANLRKRKTHLWYRKICNESPKNLTAKATLTTHCQTLGKPSFTSPTTSFLIAGIQGIYKEGAAGITRLTLALKDAQQWLSVNRKTYAGKLMIQTQVKTEVSRAPHPPNSCTFAPWVSGWILSWESSPIIFTCPPPAMPAFGETRVSVCIGKETSLTFCRASWYCGSDESCDSEWYGDNPFLRVLRSPVLDCCKDNDRKQDSPY